MKAHNSIRLFAIDRTAVMAALALLVVLAAPRAATAQTLAYQPRDGQQFGYDIKAEADRGTHVDKLSGSIVYTVKSVTDGKIALSWTSHVRMQETARTAGRGGPGPRPAFAAVPSSGTQNGTLQINAQGDVISTRGTAHLPYLLGDAALLMIETLPEAGRDNWKLEASVTLAESGERLPGPPRGSDDANRKKSTANETITCKVIKRGSGELAIQKRSELKTVELVNGKPRIEINGTGQWVFDTERQIPKRLEYKQAIVARAADRTSVEIPITLTCQPLSDEEIKRIEDERQQQWALIQQKVQEQKAKQAQPLDDEARKAVLADLQSGQPFKMERALQKLANRPVIKDDQALVAAIKALLTHKNMGIRHAAADAWAKYSGEAKAP